MNSDNIVKLAKLLGARRIRKSTNYVMFNCPFAKWTHSGGDDYKPSFGVSVSKESVYHCFSCGVKGKLKSLPMNLSLFNNRAMVEIQEFINAYDSDDTVVSSNFCYYDLSIITNLYQSMAELKENALFSKKDIDLWGLKYDKNKNAIVFPVYDSDGRLVALKGRTLGQKSFFYYDGSMSIKKHGIWFGQHIVRATIKKIVLCEGERDAIYLSRYGLTVWASLGQPTEEQITTIKMRNNDFVLFFDNDKAGQQITENLIKKCKFFVNMYVIKNYHGFKDPAEVVENKKLIEVLSSAEPLDKNDKKML